MDKYTTELSSATQSRFLRSIFRLTFCLLLVVFTTTAFLGLSLNVFQILLCQLRLRVSSEAPRVWVYAELYYDVKFFRVFLCLKIPQIPWSVF